MCEWISPHKVILRWKIKLWLSFSTLWPKNFVCCHSKFFENSFNQAYKFRSHPFSRLMETEYQLRVVMRKKKTEACLNKDKLISKLNPILEFKYFSYYKEQKWQVVKNR